MLVLFSNLAAWVAVPQSSYSVAIYNNHIIDFFFGGGGSGSSVMHTCYFPPKFQLD